MRAQALKRGFVLHRRDYRNSSLLLEVFSAEHGRLACLAKGAKAAPKGRGALASLLQPFQPLWLHWVGRGEVKTLTRAEAAAPAIALSGERLYCGFYLNELLMRLLARDDPQEPLFVFYQQALADLATEPMDAVLRRFELRLLEELGYALDLRRDRHGAPIDPSRYYGYRPDVGLEPLLDPRWESVPEPVPVVASSLAPAALVSGATLQRLAAGSALSPRESRAARGLMRAALAPHLGPKPLRSRELFRRRPG
ncbi:DNA repair protein RecO [Halochromatium salexigens]|uniref:DNA repair protein RecO n=1 Tax=Halochromatium salexigens TaxID=49447 RepID=A0AAJ0XHS9_HALSE|nr:DNA repair protein RecO [Halochromatium salexigens]MBK5932146.1 DNA repair protein RecO [Halochromatium salexigens]